MSIFLNPNEKRSLTISIRIQTNFYFKKYPELFKSAENLDRIVQSIFFYWVRNSARKSYLWTDKLKSLSVLEESSNEIRDRIKEIVLDKMKESNPEMFKEKPQHSS